MSTAPSMLASVPVDLLSASAHRPRWDVIEMLRRLAARAVVEQAREHPAHSLSRRFDMLPHTSSRRFARRAVALQQRVAASTIHHREAP
ncbi:hypothetical protein J155_02060 [Xanthomonas citri pv. citri]|uniref:Uncharacterized protein n=2 Tax=Xanthomonas citri TaxID=346 RepID=A0A0U5FCW4_XANCI|nr:hypothetical protein XAC29_09695 [Xanthomonas axonopodis Xac29-1]AJD68507.1 hypothetical protein J151_02070 [Xanthomonas citri subsp. citri A306]AJY82032.1 hypothetical protein J159_02058 [Xanthomonas citri pv. citri]AJY86455.1 hypothetical protein J158_02059 [Xanthomonas citri subsp. citri UI6]AJY90887.1 hypothetical protein J169_02067 [Xanthomonas citri pv. citri]